MRTWEGARTCCNFLAESAATLVLDGGKWEF
jgi:hypothetical protein